MVLKGFYLLIFFRLKENGIIVCIILGSFKRIVKLVNLNSEGRDLSLQLYCPIIVSVFIRFCLLILAFHHLKFHLEAVYLVILDFRRSNSKIGIFFILFCFQFSSSQFCLLFFKLHFQLFLDPFPFKFEAGYFCL